MTQKQNSNVPAIIVCILLFGMISFVTNLASPMGGVLENQFGVEKWMGTLGVFANFIAYAIMGIPAGNILQKKGYKFTALTAVAVGFIGVGVQTIAGISPKEVAFGVYLLGAFIAGFSMCMLNIVVNPMLNKLAGGGNRGNQLVQVGGSFNSLMATAVIFLSGIFVPNVIVAKISDVFPLMYIALGIFALAFVVLLFTKIPENPTVGETVKEKSQYGPMSFRHFVLGAVAIFIYVGVEVGVPKILQDWLNKDLARVENITAKQDFVIDSVLVKKGLEVEANQALAVITIKETLPAEKGAEPIVATKVDTLRAEKAGVIVLGKDENGEEKELVKAQAEIKSGDPVFEIDTASAGPIAASVAATYWLLMLVGRLLGAALGAKVSAKTMLTTVSVVGLGLVLCAIYVSPELKWSLPVFEGREGFTIMELPCYATLLVLCGLCTSVMWGGIFNLAVEGLGKYTEKGAGIFMAMVCGGGILPLLQSAIIDWTGSFAISYWVIAAGLVYLLYYALFGSKNVNKNIPTK